MQPNDILAWVVAARNFTLCVGGAGNIDDVHQRICLSEVVEELVAQSAAEVGPGDKAGNVEELDGDRPFPAAADAVVGGAEGLFIDAGAGAVDLEVADCALWVDGGETAGG